MQYSVSEPDTDSVVSSHRYVKKFSKGDNVIFILENMLEIKTYSTVLACY